MTEVKIGGKYLWKPWCMKDGKRVPMDDDEDYGKTVTVLGTDIHYPTVAQVEVVQSHAIRFGRTDELEAIPDAKE